MLTRPALTPTTPILAEALEKWPHRPIWKEVVPQLVPIIEILAAPRRCKIQPIGEGGGSSTIQMTCVHMAHMDIHYGFCVNGVAAIHTEILKR